MNNIEKIRNLIVNFIKDKFESKGAHKVMLGLSGGIDSALCLALACDALGPTKVYGYLMPYSFNENFYDANFYDAEKLANNFGVTYKVTNIKPMVNMLLDKSYNKYLKNIEKARANLMARVRMSLLYLEANLKNRLVLGTCNFSELMTGSFTKWGDGAADLEPLANLPKKHIYKLAEYWNNSHTKGPHIPQKILTKKPIADLYLEQSDEDEMKISYETLNNYLMNEYKEGNFNVDKNSANRINYLIKSSEHKKEKIPVPIIPSVLLEDSSEENRIKDEDFVKIIKEAAYCTSANEIQDLVRSLCRLTY